MDAHTVKMTIEARQQRLDALRSMIKNQGKVSIDELMKQMITKWGLSDRKSKEYIECLVLFPGIYAESGYLKHKK